VDLAHLLREHCLKLRSGGAEGADTAFEVGSRREKEIYINENGSRGKYHNGFNIALDRLPNEVQEHCYRKASEVHPGWERCDDWAKSMHARNILQIEGLNGIHTDFVVYWTEYDKDFLPKGGTATAVKYAVSLGIPTFNLNIPAAVEQLEVFLLEKYGIVYKGKL